LMEQYDRYLELDPIDQLRRASRLRLTGGGGKAGKQAAPDAKEPALMQQLRSGAGQDKDVSNTFAEQQPRAAPRGETVARLQRIYEQREKQKRQVGPEKDKPKSPQEVAKDSCCGREEAERQKKPGKRGKAKNKGLKRPNAANIPDADHQDQDHEQDGPPRPSTSSNLDDTEEVQQGDTVREEQQQQQQGVGEGVAVDEGEDLMHGPLRGNFGDDNNGEENAHPSLAPTPPPAAAAAAAVPEMAHPGWQHIDGEQPQGGCGGHGEGVGGDDGEGEAGEGGEGGEGEGEPECPEPPDFEGLMFDVGQGEAQEQIQQEEIGSNSSSSDQPSASSVMDMGIGRAAELHGQLDGQRSVGHTNPSAQQPGEGASSNAAAHEVHENLQSRHQQEASSSARGALAAAAAEQPMQQQVQMGQGVAGGGGVGVGVGGGDMLAQQEPEYLAAMSLQFGHSSCFGDQPSASSVMDMGIGRAAELHGQLDGQRSVGHTNPSAQQPGEGASSNAAAHEVHENLQSRHQQEASSSARGALAAAAAEVTPSAVQPAEKRSRAPSPDENSPDDSSRSQIVFPMHHQQAPRQQQQQQQPYGHPQPSTEMQPLYSDQQYSQNVPAQYQQPGPSPPFMPTAPPLWMGQSAVGLQGMIPSGPLPLGPFPFASPGTPFQSGQFRHSGSSLDIMQQPMQQQVQMGQGVAGGGGVGVGVGGGDMLAQQEPEYLAAMTIAMVIMCCRISSPRLPPSSVPPTAPTASRTADGADTTTTTRIGVTTTTAARGVTSVAMGGKETPEGHTTMAAPARGAMKDGTYLGQNLTLCRA
ncbi:unnamed protein product, partial [Vitrella brassicaformis CCMP3155]